MIGRIPLVRGGQVDDGGVEAEGLRVPARLDADGRDPPLLALGAGQHGPADHHPQVAAGQLARLVAEELDAVGGRQDLERGDQAAAAVLTLEVVGAERLGEQAAWNVYLPLGTAVPPTILLVTPPEARDTPLGPDLIGSRSLAASAADPRPMPSSAPGAATTTVNTTRLRMRHSSRGLSVECPKDPISSRSRARRRRRI
jgi:hypothetical protein